METEGVPPGKLHAYVSALEAGAQLSISADGFIETGPQESAIGFIVARGGCFTITVRVRFCPGPQEFDITSETVYVPGVMN